MSQDCLRVYLHASLVRKPRPQDNKSIMVDWELEMEKVRKDHRAREERLKYVLVFA